MEDQGRFHGQALRERVVMDQTRSLSISDQPRYVGYSCNSGHRAPLSEDEGKDLVTFLQG